MIIIRKGLCLRLTELTGSADRFLVILVVVLYFSWFFIGESEAQIIFVDGFDSGGLNKQWHLGKSKAININYDPPHVHSGHCSMQVTAMPGKGAGGMARIFFEPGYDKIVIAQ